MQDKEIYKGGKKRKQDKKLKETLEMKKPMNPLQEKIKSELGKVITT
jgi:hypothetical protein